MVDIHYTVHNMVDTHCIVLISKKMMWGQLYLPREGHYSCWAVVTFELLFIRWRRWRIVEQSKTKEIIVQAKAKNSRHGGGLAQRCLGNGARMVGRVELGIKHLQPKAFEFFLCRLF